MRLKNNALLADDLHVSDRTFTIANLHGRNVMSEKEGCKATIGFFEYVNMDKHPDRFRECSFTVLRTNTSPKPAIAYGDIMEASDRAVGGNQSTEIVAPHALVQ